MCSYEETISKAESICNDIADADGELVDAIVKTLYNNRRAFDVFKHIVTKRETIDEIHKKQEKAIEQM